MTREEVSLIERGRAQELRLGAVRAVVGSFGGSLDVAVRGPGSDADRVLDERHAWLAGATAAWLAGLGWRVRAEVSYSEWG